MDKYSYILGVRRHNSIEPLLEKGSYSLIMALIRAMAMAMAKMKPVWATKDVLPIARMAEISTAASDNMVEMRDISSQARLTYDRYIAGATIN